MKLSNKILIGFFGFIFLYITAAFTELRMTGTLNVVTDTNSIAEHKDFTGISYLVLENAAHTINVIGDDKTQLQVRSFTGEVMKEMKYEVNGDTLRLYGIESGESKKVKITVFVAKEEFKGITINNSTTSIQHLRQEHLDISQSGGRTWMSNCTLGSLSMEASGQSYFDCASTQVDTVSLQLKFSEAVFSSQVGILAGSMEGNSLVHVPDVRDIRFKKDESSRLNLY